MVQIVGSDGGAFLYDESSPQPVLWNSSRGTSTKVRFSGGKSDEPLKILVDFKGSGFALFDADGQSEPAESAGTRGSSKLPRRSRRRRDFRASNGDDGELLGDATPAVPGAVHQPGGEAEDSRSGGDGGDGPWPGTFP